MKKIVLAGSPWFVIPTFQTILDNFKVVGVVTQPDSIKSRNKQFEETAVSKFATKNNLKLFKPKKIIEIESDLKKMNYDFFLTFAYGQIIPESILKLSNIESLNIHGSILPKYRGAAPIQRAIMNGDKEIGISLITMVKQMDAGPIWNIKKIPIDDETTSLEAFKKISIETQKNIVHWLNDIKNSIPKKQSSFFSLAPKLNKNEGELKKTMTIENAIRIIKAFNPNPVAFIFINNKRLKIFDATKSKISRAIPITFKNGIIYAFDYQWESRKRIKLI